MNKIEEYLAEMKTAFDKLPLETIDQVISILHRARLNGNQVFVMGNGGSASTASHFVCDLAKNTRNSNWPNFRVIGLTDNVAIMTAYANDEGYENALAGQLASLLHPNDIVLGISCSGNSSNVLKAIELANKNGAITIGLTGKKGGNLADMVHVNISADVDHIQQQEDIHVILCHMITIGLINIPMPLDITTRPVFTEYNTLSLADRLFGNVLVDSNEVESQSKKRSSMDMMYKISQEMAENLDLHEMLNKVLLQTLESVGASSGSIIVLDKEGEVVDGVLAYAGKVNSGSIERLNEIKKLGLAGWVAENRQPVLVQNTNQDPRWFQKEYEDRKENNSSPRSALSVPLMTSERVVGVVTLVHPQAGWFTMEDLALLTAITITMSYSFNKHQVG